MTALLQIENLSRSFAGPSGGVSAVHGVSFTVGAGEFVAVQGPSGCGKTTLLLAAGALLQPGGGRVRVNGQDPYALSAGPRALFRAEHLGFVFQQFHLVPYLDVLDNILAPMIALRRKNVALPRASSSDASAPMRDATPPSHFSQTLIGRFRPAGDEGVAATSKRRGVASARALELIERFGLTPRLHHVPAALSTGERQRVALARALLNNPKLLLADEPTGNLDEENGLMVLRCLAEFARAGAAVLLVTHEPRAGDHASRVLKMKGGRIQ